MNEASKMNQFRFHLGITIKISKTIKEIQKITEAFLNFMDQMFMNY